MKDGDKTKAQLINELVEMRQRITKLEQVEARHKQLLEQLKKSEMAYYDLYYNAPDMFVSVDARTAKIMQCNQAVVTVLGYAEEELIGRPVFEMYHPDCQKEVKKAFDAFVKTGEVHDAELQLRKKNGDKIDVGLNVSSVRDEQGNILYSRSVWRDITKRKQTEKALRNSEEKWRSLLENAPDTIATVDLNYIIQFVNHVPVGLTVDDVLGRSIYDFVPPGQHNDLHRCFDQVLETGETASYEITGSVTGAWYEGHVGPITRDERVISFVIISTDITDRKQAEDALRESESRFRQLAENIREVFWLQTPDASQILYISPTYAEIWGHTCESLYERPTSWLDSVYPADRERVTAAFDKQQEGQFFDEEYRIIRPDESIRWIWARAFPVRDEQGTVYRITGIAEDITERKQALELARVQQQQLLMADKMASLGILVSGVAHEINNPNNFIMLNAEILEVAFNDAMPILEKYYRENGDFIFAGMPYTLTREKIRGLISGISQGAGRIQKIVDTLRDFAHQDGGNLNQLVDCNAVVESATIIVQNLIMKSTHHFSVEFAENLPTVRGNPQQLEQVLINLITNSCQALSEPNQSLTVSTAYHKRFDSVLIKVCDEGEGIAPENLKHIMDAFFTTRRDTGGTGLGLSVSYNIVKNHGGDLTFTSKFGKTTTATVTLPVSHYL